MAYCLGFLIVWYLLARGLTTLACKGVAGLVGFLDQCQRRTGLARTGRAVPADLARQIESALPRQVRIVCWGLAFLLTGLLFGALMPAA